MELTKEQFAKIEHLLPTPRKKPTLLCEHYYTLLRMSANGGQCQKSMGTGIQYMSNLIIVGQKME